METCKCRYEPIFGPSGQLVGGNIRYCPRHAAADAMYEALKDARYGLYYLDKHGFGGGIDWERRLRKLDAALALADEVNDE